MLQHEIITATLGISYQWQITSVSFSNVERSDVARRIDISLDHAQSGIACCPACRTEGAAATIESETWHHPDYFRFAAYLHARVLRIACCFCGITTVDRPWTRPGSKFTLVSTDATPSAGEQERSARGSDGDSHDDCGVQDNYR